jgi:hypothetical protein
MTDKSSDTGSADDPTSTGPRKEQVLVSFKLQQRLDGPSPAVAPTSSISGLQCTTSKSAPDSHAAAREFRVDADACVEWLRLLLGGLGGSGGTIYFGGRALRSEDKVCDVIRMAAAATRERWMAGKDAIPLTYTVAQGDGGEDGCVRDQDQGSRGEMEASRVAVAAGQSASDYHHDVREQQQQQHGSSPAATLRSDVRDVAKDIHVVVRDTFGERGDCHVYASGRDTVRDVVVRMLERHRHMYGDFAWGADEDDHVRVVCCGLALERDERVWDAWRRVGGEGRDVEMFVHVHSKVGKT